jgi:protein-L-isoaspartate(D-aspartate) O-methyltransferase
MLFWASTGSPAIQPRWIASPVNLYTDDVIGILPERNPNNGQPSLHAALIAAAAPQPREHVVHVGAGVGFYKAILAELIGATGRVTAIAFNGEVAARGTANFTQTRHVCVVHGDGTRIVFEPVDVICQCRRDAARGSMARPANGGGRADPAR